MNKKFALFALFTALTILSCFSFSSKPIADFSFSGEGPAPCLVSFENQSDHATSYTWNFGDGTTSHETNPTKLYDAPGSYSVTLTAERGTEADSITIRVIVAPPLRPEVTISPVQLSITLPVNCPAQFTISNSGQKGSTLHYTVADDGALQGFLDVENDTGSLSSGDSARITVSVKPEFQSTGFGTIAGSTLVLHVLTPNASNAATNAVSIAVTSVLGTWSGTWSGISNSSGTTNTEGLTSPVSGTWILDLQSTDNNDSTASGTLTWKGIDKFWVYTFDASSTIIATPHPFIPDRTLLFDRSNSAIQFPYSSCDIILLHIKNYRYGTDAPSQDAFYGPSFDICLNTRTNSAGGRGSGFFAHPYDASNNISVCSYGDVTGSKQK